MMRSLRVWSFAVLAISVAAASAFARPTRVAFCKIEGDTTGLSKAVTGALDDSELEVVAGSPVTRAIDRLGLDDALSDRDIGKLAAELEVDAVLKGALEPRGHRVRFTIFSNGKKGRTFILQVGDAGTDKFRKLVRKMIVSKVAAVVPPKGKASEDGDEVAEPAEKSEKSEKSEKPDKSGKHKPKQEADDETPDKLADKSPDKASDKPSKHKAKPAADDTAAEADARPAKKKAKPASDDDAAATTTAADADTKSAAADAPAPRKRVAASDDDGPADGPADGVAARAEPAGPMPHSTHFAAIRVDLGASMAGRSLKFDSASIPNAPRPYKNAPVPGARLAAELYPFAFRDPGNWLAGFGVAAQYDQVVALTIRASDEMTVPLKITERHYAFGLRYRLALGHRPTSPTLTFGAGYGAQSFAVNRSGLMTPTSLDLPDVDYRMIDPGVTFRLPLGSRVAITLGGEGLIVTSAGAIQRSDQYGKAKIFGGAASAGVELVIADRVALRLAGEATQLDLSFAGTGTLATSRDGNSATVDVHGATDRYYGGAATVAVTY